MFLRIILIIMTLLTISSTYIIFRGPSSWDRLQGLAVLSSKAIMIIVLLSLFHEQAYFVDLAILFSLLGFISLMLIARHISGRKKL